MQAPTRPTIQTISLGGRPAAFVDTGPGPPDTLILIHGAPGRPQDFRHLLPHLAPRLRVIAPGLPGHGLTPLDTDPAEDLVGRLGFVKQLVEALQIERPFIGGHSMGGGLAMLLAEALGARTRGLVLLASVGMTRHRGLRNLPPRITRALLGSPAQPMLTPVFRAAFRALGFPPGISDEAMLHTIRCAAALDFDRIRAAVAAISAPTLIASADDDPIVEPSIAEALARAAPPGPRLRFATGGHAFIKPHARPVAEAICEWADALS